MKPWLIVVIALTGCVPHTAVIDGKTVPRATLYYSDHRWFAFEHWDAYPAPIGASSGHWTYGGRIAGIVCGVDVTMFADYYGRRLAVDGYYQAHAAMDDITYPARYTVTDRNDGRHIEGVMGVDMRLTHESLDYELLKRFSIRTVHLRAGENDTLEGTVETFGFTMPFLVRGAHVLFAMPPEDQATLLPLMLACPTSVRRDGSDEIVSGFDLTGKHDYARR
jgi:hypothetical protein